MELNHTTSEESDQLAVSGTSSKTRVSKNTICRYYRMANGCGRGEQCFFTHVEGEFETRPRNLLPSLNSAASVPYMRHSKMNASSLEDLNKKVFVGGLSPSVEADDLKIVFEEKFGPIQDAVVIGTNSGDQVPVSRGFGFVIFQHEKSVLFAVQAHYVYIFGRKVEIKSAIPRLTLTQLEIPKRNLNAWSTTVSEVAEEASECSSSSSQGSDEQSASFSTTPTPAGRYSVQSSRVNAQVQWVSRFKEWLPQFLVEISNRMREGEWYPLSALKADFRATCGIKLDHEGIGYQKLNDFIKSFPTLCKVIVLPVGGGPATHMVLVPGAVEVRTMGAQQVQELHGKVKSPMASQSYESATCHATASYEPMNVDSAVSSHNLGSQIGAINEHFDDHSASTATELWVQNTLQNMHLAESIRYENQRKTDHALRAQESQSPEFANGSRKASHVTGVHRNVGLQDVTSHGHVQKMKSGTEGHLKSDLVKNLAIMMKRTPARCHTAPSEVGISGIHNTSLLCAKQALTPVRSHATNLFTDNFTEEPTTPTTPTTPPNQVTLTPFSTYDNQTASFPTRRNSTASSSYNIWTQKKSPRNLKFPHGEVEGKEIVQDVDHAASNDKAKGRETVHDVDVHQESGNQLPSTCGLCSTSRSIWIALPCKHYGICSPCKKLFTGGAICTACGYKVERWIRL